MKRRERILRALKAAKQPLSDTYRIGEREQFICFALYRTVRFGASSYEDYLDARNLILERLAPFNCVEDWLKANVGHKAFYAARQKNQDVIQEYRHRWLDALIKEFSRPA